MLHLLMTAAFHDVQKPGEIAVCIGMGIFQRITYTGLCGQVDHAVKSVIAEQCRHTVAIGQFHLPELKTIKAVQPVETALFQADVVVVIEIVDTDDPVSHLNQFLAGKCADKTRRAGHQYLHSEASPLLTERTVFSNSGSMALM